MDLSPEQIIFVKRSAMSQYFWAPCPDSDDYGFDRLMAMDNIHQIKDQEWGAVFLHTYFDEHSLNVIQSNVLSQGIRMLCILAGLSPSAAFSALRSVESTDYRNPEGYYSHCHHENFECKINSVIWKSSSSNGITLIKSS